jgi:hypothetical protein
MSERLNSMSRDELLEFARFAYTAYPTLLVTHEKRLAFFEQYPDKDPNTYPADDRQMSLDLGQEEHSVDE